MQTIDKELLLSFVRGCERIDLYKNPRPLTPKQRICYNSLLAKYRKGCPIAYLVGHAEFMSLDFVVNTSVLIPRPETEFVVEEALRTLSRIDRPVVMDIGTGSGNIAVTIASHAHAKHIRIFASDISRKALQVAHRNAKRHEVDKYIRFDYGDLFSAFPKSLKGKIDIIISNPPYVSPAEFRILPASVREYEPAKALWAGQKGLEFYRRIVDSAPEYLKPSGHLIMEMGYRQSKAVREILEQNGSFGNINIVKDYLQIERIIIATKKPKN